MSDLKDLSLFSATHKVFSALLDEDLWSLDDVVSSDEFCPPDLLDCVVARHISGGVLAHSNSDLVLKSVASNPNLSTDTLNYLLSFSGLRHHGAANESLSGSVLQSLWETYFVSGTLDLLIASSVAGNPNCPTSVLFDAVLSNHDRVGYAAANNVSWKTADIEKFLSNKNLFRVPDVYYKLLSNPAVSSGFLASVLKSSNMDVAELLAVAANPSASPDTLVYLASTNVTTVLAALAANPSTPANVLDSLADRCVYRLDLALATNYVTPPQILAGFADDSDAELAYSALENVSCPVSVLQDTIASDPYDFGVVAAQTLRLDPSLTSFKVRMLSDDLLDVQTFNILAALAKTTDVLSALVTDPATDVGSAFGGLSDFIPMSDLGSAGLFLHLKGLTGVCGGPWAPGLVFEMFASGVLAARAAGCFSVAELLVLQKLASERSWDVSCFSTPITPVRRTSISPSSRRVSGVHVRF